MKNQDKNIIVIIPAFNEASHIAGIIKELRNQGLSVLVVDDGSKDQTSVLSEQHGAIVLRNEKNIGKGASLRRGFEFALSGEYRCIITMDGDGQHPPEQIHYFLETQEKEKAGIVVGNRMHNPRGMPLLRWLTNSFMSWLLSRICNQPIPDSQCGFRLVSRDALEKIALTTSKFEIESELLVRAARAGIKIASVPICSIYEDSVSHIHPFKDTVRFIKFICRFLWTSEHY